MSRLRKSFDCFWRLWTKSTAFELTKKQKQKASNYCWVTLFFVPDEDSKDKIIAKTIWLQLYIRVTKMVVIQILFLWKFTDCKLTILFFKSRNCMSSIVGILRANRADFFLKIDFLLMKIGKKMSMKVLPSFQDKNTVARRSQHGRIFEPCTMFRFAKRGAFLYWTPRILCKNERVHSAREAQWWKTLSVV